jgi:hypothetical protein
MKVASSLDTGWAWASAAVWTHPFEVSWLGFFLILLWGQNNISYFFYSFLHFWPTLGVFSYKPCKTSETPKLVEIVSIKPYLLSLVWILYRYWRVKLCNKDHQQAPPHLALCSSSSKVQD